MIISNQRSKLAPHFDLVAEPSASFHAVGPIAPRAMSLPCATSAACRGHFLRFPPFALKKMVALINWLSSLLGHCMRSGDNPQKCRPFHEGVYSLSHELKLAVHHRVASLIGYLTLVPLLSGNDHRYAKKYIRAIFEPTWERLPQHVEPAYHRVTRAPLTQAGKG